MTLMHGKMGGRDWLSYAALLLVYLIVPVTLFPVASAADFEVDSDDYGTERTINTMDIDVYKVHLKANDAISFEVKRTSGSKLTIYFFDMKHYFEATHNTSFPTFDCCSETNTANLSANFNVNKEADYGILITVADQGEGNSTYSLEIRIRRAGGITTLIITVVVLILAIGVVIGLVWFSGSRRLRKRMEKRMITRRKGKGGKGGKRMA